MSERAGWRRKERPAGDAGGAASNCHSRFGIGWTAITAVVMFSLATGKHRTGYALNNPVLIAEGRVTVVDGLLAVAVLLGLALNASLGWWWADPLAGLVIVYYAVKEARGIHHEA